MAPHYHGRLRVPTVLCVATVLLVGPGPVLAQDGADPAKPVYEASGDELSVLVDGKPVSQLKLPCEASAQILSGEALFVGCDLGVVVVDLGNSLKPKVVGVRDVGGPVVGFVMVDEQPWAQIQRLEARPVRAAAPLTSPVVVTGEGKPRPTKETEPDEPETVPVPVGEVVSLEVGEVVVSLGAEQGVKRGDHVELYLEHEVSLGAGETSVREEQLAVGNVATASANRSVVELGLGERVPLRAKARPTKKKETSERLVPPRVEAVWDVSGAFRPFLALGTFGFGTVSDAQVGYRFGGWPLHVFARFDPVGVGFAEEGNIVSMAGNALVAYDTDLFEIGLGLGWSAVNDSIDGDSAAASDGGGFTTDVDEVRSGLSIAQYARLGALDGLHLAAYNTFLLYDDEFHYGGTVGVLQSPVGDRSWFIVRGGGGVAGYAYGELGLRVLLVGNGDRGSWFLTPSVGGAFLFGQKDIDCQRYDPNTDTTITVENGCVDDIEYGGPMVGLGFETRL